MMLRAIILVILFVALLLTATAVAQTLQPSLSSGQFAPSLLVASGQIASSANYSTVSTVGQPSIGQSTSADYALCSGIWCQAIDLYRVFLSLLMKGF